MQRRRPRVTLVASGIVSQIPGGVRMRWQSLRQALEPVARMASFPVACDQFTGCRAGCDLDHHRANNGDDDPFAVHFCPKLFDRLVAHIKSTKTRIAVVTNVQLHRYVRELSQTGLCRVVYDMHNAEYPLWRDIQAVAPPPWRDAFYSEAACTGLQQAEGAAIAAADQVWTCSARDSDRVEETYGTNPNKLRVVPNVIRLAPPTITRRPEHVLFTGRFDYYPNAEAMQTLVTHIAPRLAVARPDLSIVLAGAGLPATPPNGPGNVRFVPNPGEMGPLISAGIMTVPLTLGGGTRFKILEAFATGSPVVSTKKGAEGLDLTDGHHYLRAETSEQFVAAISQLMTDDRLRESLAARTVELVQQNYSTTALSSTLRDCLRDLL